MYSYSCSTACRRICVLCGLFLYTVIIIYFVYSNTIHHSPAVLAKLNEWMNDSLSEDNKIHDSNTHQLIIAINKFLLIRVLAMLQTDDNIKIKTAAV